MIYYFARLPASLGRGPAWSAGAAKVDLVDASESVFHSCVGAMSVTLVLASAAGVFQVLG